MSQRLPDKVRAGDKLSAAWMNGVVDYLKYLYDLQLRRRLLKGVGYAVTESAAGSSLTIDKQAIARVLSDDLDVMGNEDFQLRLKPKGLCEVNPESGDWDKVVQVHIGRITDHRNAALTVSAKGGDDAEDDGQDDAESDGQDGSASWDAADWVDMGALESLGEGGSADEIEVYVKLTLTEGRAVRAVFVTGKQLAEAGSNVDDDSGSDMDPPSTLLIPIGKVGGANVEGSPRYYITQYQLGPIDFIPLARFSGEPGKASDVDGEDSSSDVDDYPGLLASARAETQEESAGSAHWLISAGELVVPLAHAPLPPPTPDEADEVKPRAGLILGVAVAPGAGSDVDGSNVDGEPARSGLWYIENGILYHPDIGEVELCNYSAPSAGADKDGLIRGIGSHTSGWSIAQGDIRIPLAHQNGQDASGWNGEGLITRAGWLPDGESVPRVSQGQVLFPRLSTGTTREPLANFNNSPVADNAGTVCGIEYRSDIDAPRIADGVVQLVGAGSDVDGSSLYVFDPGWFTVTDSYVTLKPEAIDDVVAEAVGEIAVNVTAHGVLSSTAFGSLGYNTTTTSSSLGALALDTKVAYQ